MVDVSDKPARRAKPKRVRFVAIRPDVLASLPKNPKGDPLEVAQDCRHHGCEAHF